MAALRAMVMQITIPTSCCQRQSTAGVARAGRPSHHGSQERKRQRKERMAEADHLQELPRLPEHR